MTKAFLCTTYIPGDACSEEFLKRYLNQTSSVLSGRAMPIATRGLLNSDFSLAP